MSTTPPPDASDAAPASPAASPAAAPAASAGSAPRGGWLGALLVAIVAVGLYWDTLDHELVYDDWFLINPQTNSSMLPVIEDYGAVWDLFGQEYWEGVTVGGLEAFGARGQALYRPLTTAIWATITHYSFHDKADAFSGSNPQAASKVSVKAYHAVNLIANALTCVVFFFLLRRLFGNSGLALLGALIYTVHPLHSEAVAYVAGLSDILTALAVFLGLLLWERAVRQPGRLRVGAYAGMLITLFLGLLAKESAILLLPAVALADLALSLSGRLRVALAQRLAVYAGLLAVIGTNIAIRWQILGRLLPDKLALSYVDNPLVLDHVTTWVRMLNSAKLIAKYAWLTLWPAELSMDYSFNQIPVSTSFSEPAVMSGAVLILALLVVGLVRLRTRPALAFGLLLFLGTTAFFANLLAAIGTIFAERLTYLPSAGAALAIAAVFFGVFGNKQSGRATLHPVGLLLAVVLLGALGMRTYERNKDFRSAVVLFESAAEASPNSTRVHYQLGSIYETQKLYPKAIKELETALAIDGNFFQAAIRRAEVLAKAQQFEAAEASYRKIIGALALTNRDGSSNSEVHAMLHRGLAGVQQSRGDLAGAAESLARARDYGDEGTDDNEVALVALLQGQDKWAESLAVIEDGLQEKPDSVRLLLARARAAVQLSDYDTYQSSLDGLDTTPEGAQLAEMMRAEVKYNNAAYNRDDQALEEATAVFERIQVERPDYSTPHVFKGRYLLDISDDAEAAIIELDKALELNPRDPDALRNKTIALMRLERWEQALQTLELLATVNPDIAYLQLLADVHFQLGNTEAFETAFEQIEAQIPEGQSLADFVIKRALIARDKGDAQAAIDTIERALLAPVNAENVRLLVLLGSLLSDQGRFEEALLAYDRAEASFAAQPDLVYDEYLPIRRSLCLMALGRDMEAAGALERAKAALNSLEWAPVDLDTLRVSYLHRSAMLHLRKGGAFHDPDLVEELCQEGIALTAKRGGNFPPFYNLSIDAFLQRDRVADAAQRARAGEQAFEGTPHKAIYALAAEALEAVAAGDKAKGLDLLSASTVPFHKQLHDQLKGS